jgi:transposase
MSGSVGPRTGRTSGIGASDVARAAAGASEAWHEPTKRYVARHAVEGNSRREIRRCLTRATARQLFRLLERQPATAG